MVQMDWEPDGALETVGATVGADGAASRAT